MSLLLASRSAPRNRHRKLAWYSPAMPAPISRHQSPTRNDLLRSTSHFFSGLSNIAGLVLRQIAVIARTLKTGDHLHILIFHKRLNHQQGNSTGRDMD